MRVDSLSLSGFRNYENALVWFDPGINVITGENAQGKTNLLEAVFMLTGGKSFRTRFDKELIGFDKQSAEITAAVFAHERELTIKILLRRGLAKQITQNGVKKKSSELGENLSAVLFCPDDLNIIRAGAGARRRLMDMAISQLRPGYAALLSEYTRLYEHKTRILRDWREKPSLLDTLDEFSLGLCRNSAQLIRYRASFAKRLCAQAAVIHSDFSGGRETLSVEYKTVSTVKDPFAPASEIYAQLLEHQRAHRQAELDSGLCLSGAHKDDLEISINSRAARSFASQGQTRTAALSLKLAEREIFLEETGEYPVLLLDDVLSELDTGRQEFVLNRIGGGQTFITCCEDEGIASRTGGRVICVSAGQIL
jgi:DNA replication and repair protein RecF